MQKVIVRRESCGRYIMIMPSGRLAGTTDSRLATRFGKTDAIRKMEAQLIGKYTLVRAQS